MKKSKSSTSSKKSSYNYNILIIGLVIIAAIAIFMMFFRGGNRKDIKDIKDIKTEQKTEENKENKREPRKENKEIKNTNTPTPTPKSALKIELDLCQNVRDAVFDTGLIQMYESIMGKAFPETRYECNGKSSTQIYSDLGRISNLIDDLLLKILKTPDSAKRNNDLVFLWLTVGYGLFSSSIKQMLGGKDVLTVVKDGDTIKTISLKYGLPTKPTPSPSDYFMTEISPSLMISSVDDKKVNDDPDESNTKKEIKTLASSLVNQNEINQLRNDTETKMTVNKFASCLIYTISKTSTFFSFL